MSAPTPMIRVLPVWQPYASLLISGAKRIETRAYPPTRLGLRAGQRIGIHAAKERRGLSVCGEWPFTEYVADADSLPLGAVIGTAILDRATQMTAEAIVRLEAGHEVEREFGFYEPGRWAWVLRDPQPLPQPVPPDSVPAYERQGAFDFPLELLGLTVADVPEAAAVYADSFDESPIAVPAKWQGGGHMQADTSEALHAMAAKLGLKPQWFQSKPGRPEHDHYDLTRSKREQAIRLGAIPINWREQSDIRRAVIAARRDREQAETAREAA